MTRTRPTAAGHRRGSTLAELMVSLLAAGTLLSGMASTVFLCVTGSDRSATPDAATLDAIATLSELAADLRFADAITERTSTAITVTVPDRDLDMLAETVRYAWSGTPGDPLTRQYNGGGTVTVAEDVHDLAIQYRPASGPVHYLDVALQLSANGACRVQDAFTLPNRP